MATNTGSFYMNGKTYYYVTGIGSNPPPETATPGEWGNFQPIGVTGLGYSPKAIPGTLKDQPYYSYPNMYTAKQMGAYPDVPPFPQLGGGFIEWFDTVTPMYCVFAVTRNANCYNNNLPFSEWEKYMISESDEPLRPGEMLYFLVSPRRDSGNPYTGYRAITVSGFTSDSGNIRTEVIIRPPETSDYGNNEVFSGKFRSNEVVQIALRAGIRVDRGLRFTGYNFGDPPGFANEGHYYSYTPCKTSYGVTCRAIGKPIGATSVSLNVNGRINVGTTVRATINYTGSDISLVHFQIILRNTNNPSDSIVINDNYFPNTNTFYYDISPNSYSRLKNYEVLVTPYIVSGAERYYGDTAVSPQKFIAVSPLNIPVISYPKLKSPSINYTLSKDKTYILFELPNDPDYQYYDSYVYSDITVDINGQLVSYKTSPSSFSVNSLTHRRKVVFKFPSNAPNYNYTVKIKVTKNYPGGTLDSEWSQPIIIQKADSTMFTPTVGNQIMASSYNNPLSDSTIKLASSYADSYVTRKVTAGSSIITRNDYRNIYQDLNSVVDKINNWGTYDKTSLKLQSLPSFVPEIVVVKASGDDGYMLRAYQWLQNFV